MRALASRRARMGAVVVAAAVLAACQDVTGPDSRQYASLAIAPVIAPGPRPPDILPIDNVRIRVNRMSGDLVQETVVPFPADSSRLSVRLRVPLQGRSERLRVTVELRSGLVVLYSGSAEVEVWVEGQGPVATSQPSLSYVGPGGQIARIQIAPRDTVLSFGDLLTLRVSAFDAGGNQLPDPAVVWSMTPSLAPISAAGLLTAPLVRGTVMVRAVMTSGLADSTRLRFVPRPTALTILSGNAQQGAIGSLLAAPLAVVVKAADGLGVAGVQVRFRAISAGGSVRDAQVTTDDNGRAETVATLGSTVGAYTYEAAVTGLTAVTFTENAIASVASALTIVSGNNQSALAGIPLPSPLVVKATDAAGNPVSGTVVDWTILAGGGLLGAATTTTGPDGTTQMVYTLGAVPGAATIRAALHNAPAVTVSFTETALAGAGLALSIVSGNNQSALVGLPLANPLVVKVTDAFGSPVAGQQVDWTILSGGGLLGSATTTTGSDGTTQVLYTVGSTPGSATIRAALHSAPASAVQFTATALAATASALSIVSGNNQSALVGLQLPAPLVVKATDAAGRAVSGAQIDWTIVSGGGSLGSATTTTGSDGTTQVLYTLGSVAGPATIRAALHNASSVTVSFTETALAAAASALTLVSGDNQSALVGLPLPNPLVVKATDAAGRAVSGAQIDWTIVSGGGSLGSATTTTGSDGTTQVLYTLGSVAGPATIRAALHNAPAVTVSFTETALAAVASALAIVSGNNQSAPVGLPLANPLVVRATDAAGRPVSGAQIDWTIVSGGGLLGSATTTTGSDGTTQVLYTLGSVAGPATIRAALHNAPAVTVSFTETALSAGSNALTLVSGDNQSALVGLQLPAPLVVKATDAGGNPVSGAAVDWTIVSGGGQLSSATTTTAPDGTTQVLYTLGSVAGSATIRAALHNAPSVTVSFTETALAAVASALAIVSGNNQSDLVGVQLTNPLVVKATDAAGRAVSGAQIDWTIVSGGGSLGSASTTTGSDGTTQVLYTLGSVAGPATIRAALHNAPSVTVSFTETALAAVASALAIVSGNNQSALVGLPLANPLVVKATDAAGRAVSGAQIDWTIVSGGGSLGSATTTTGSDGTTQVLYTLGSVAGPATIRAALHNAPAVTVSFTETALAAAASALAIVSGNNQSALVGLPLANPLVVKATDAAGRAVSGAQIDWTIVSGGGSLGSASTTTGSDGTTQVLYTLGSVAGPATIRAALHNAPAVTVSFTETALAAVASALAIVSGNNQSDLAGLPLANPLVVKATDAAGRAVSGAQIDWTIVSGGGSLGSATTTTGSDGTTQVLYTLGSVAGPATIRAALHNAPAVTVSFTETALAAVASALAIVSGNNQSDLAGLPLANPLVVKATDAAGRAVSGAQIDWTIVSGGGSLGSATTTTGSDGTTQVLYTLGSVAGPATIRAALHNAPTVTVSFTETALAAAASALAIVSGNNQSDLVGLQLANPLVVKATDAAGRAVSGAQIDWTIVSGGGSLGSATTTTGSDGTTQVLYTLGSVAGPATIRAALHNAPAVTVSFTETALAAAASALAIVSGNNQSDLVGLQLANPLVVKATDAAGRAVSGAQIDWTIVSGGGLLGSATTTTGSDGTTQVLYTLGSVAGPATIRAALHNAPAVTVSFTETALAAVASALAIVSGNNQSALVGLPLANPMVVKATDAAGRAVSGAQVDWTIVSGGGSLGSATTTTGSDGTTQVLYTLGSVAGPATIRAALHNAPAVTVSFTETALAAAASALAIVSGNNQSDLVGLQLTDPLVVKATDAAGRAVSGAQVDWTIVSGGGSLGSATTTTGSDGTTQVLYTLGSVAGPATIRAALHNAPAVTVSFTETALAAVASALAIVSGNNQSALVGLPLANPLVVKATDAAGRAVSGAQIDWTIVSGGGSLGSATTTTGSDGTTQVLYTLGSVAGPATIRAALHNAPAVTVSFTETALAAAASALTLVSGDNQSALVGLPLANPLVVKATDAAGRAVSGAQIDWTIVSGGGSLGSATTTTGSDGTTQVLYTLGSVAGPATIRAALHNAPAVTVSFTETALAAAASALAIVSGNNQSDLVGLQLANPLVVKATDAAGRAVSGAQVDWTIVSGGGSLGSATTTTGSDGTTQVLYTLGSVAGPATIRAALHNAPAVTVSFTETALAAVASALAIVSGNNQSDLVGLPLANPLVVKATDAAGRAVSGAQIDWTIVSGGGSLGSTTTTTGSDGTTQVLYTLGSVAGPATIRAALHNAPAVTVSFTETALAAVATALTIVSGDNQSALGGLQLPSPLVVKATDAAGRAVSGAQVDWTIVSGGGLLSAATTTTGADGTTQVLYTLPVLLGTKSIRAALHNNPAVQVVFTATGL